MTPPRPILARYKLVVPGFSHVISLHVCPRSSCYLCVCRSLKACLRGLLLFFILFCGLFHNSLPTLGVGLPLILGFTFLPAHFLLACSAIVSCHSCCNDLILPSPFLGLPYILSPMSYHYHGHSYLWLLCPFFPWASLAHLFALGFLSPFTSFVFPWAFY